MNEITIELTPVQLEVWQTMNDTERKIALNESLQNFYLQRLDISNITEKDNDTVSGLVLERIKLTK